MPFSISSCHFFKSWSTKSNVCGSAIFPLQYILEYWQSARVSVFICVSSFQSRNAEEELREATESMELQTLVNNDHQLKISAVLEKADPLKVHFELAFVFFFYVYSNIDTWWQRKRNTLTERISRKQRCKLSKSIKYCNSR